MDTVLLDVCTNIEGGRQALGARADLGDNWSGAMPSGANGSSAGWLLNSAGDGAAVVAVVGDKAMVSYGTCTNS